MMWVKIGGGKKLGGGELPFRNQRETMTVMIVIVKSDYFLRQSAG